MLNLIVIIIITWFSKSKCRTEIILVGQTLDVTGMFIDIEKPAFFRLTAGVSLPEHHLLRIAGNVTYIVLVVNRQAISLVTAQLQANVVVHEVHRKLRIAAVLQAHEIRKDAFWAELVRVDAVTSVFLTKLVSELSLVHHEPALVFGFVARVALNVVNASAAAVAAER